jgi:hypothetical protein
VGAGALPSRTRLWAVAVGLVLSIAIWVFGQDLGQLYSGQATDPNSAPLIALMALALLARPEHSERQGYSEFSASSPLGLRPDAETRPRSATGA